MDILTHAQFLRAHSVLSTALKELGGTEKDAVDAFAELARSMALQQHAGEQRKAIEAFRDHPNQLLAKAAVGASAYGQEPFENDSVRALMAAYLKTIAPWSGLDALKVYAQPIPAGSRHVMIGSGFVADATVEGAPKVVRSPSFTLGDIEPHKTVALIVATREFMQAGGDEALAMLDREMSKAIIAAINGALFDFFADSNALSLPTTGDALEDLRLATGSAGPSEGFVALVPPGVTADLALRTEALPGFTMNGGEFRPGLHVVTADNATGIMAVPASRTAIYDGGLELRPSGDASIELSDSPTGSGEMVSLWQCGSVGLLAERQWHIGGDAVAVIVEGS